MTPAKLAEIQRRAQQDATAHRSGWPTDCPYSSVDESQAWRKAFDLAELKDKK
jgi:hypothetical protein